MNAMSELEKLLEWAKKMSLFIEIRGSGETEIQIQNSIEEYVFLTQADTLKEALKLARSKFVI